MRQIEIQSSSSSSTTTTTTAAMPSLLHLGELLEQGNARYLRVDDDDDVRYMCCLRADALGAVRAEATECAQVA